MGIGCSYGSLLYHKIIKHFLWRLMRHCLPTRTNLHSKNVQCPLDCVHYNSGIENEWQLFLPCKHVQYIWKVSHLWHIIEHKWDNDGSFHDLIFEILSVSTPEIRSRIGTILWCIQKDQNNKLWDHVEISPNHGFIISHAIFVSM